VSDNGQTFGDDRWDHKLVPYERSIRYPNELRNVVSLKTTKAATLRKKTYLNAAIHRSSRRPKGAGTIRRMRSSD